MADETMAPKYTEIQYRGMKSIVYTQVLGSLMWMIFGNGMMLLYLRALEFTPAEILFYIALPNLANAFLSMPLAYYSDCHGKKKLGVPGLTISVFAFAAIGIPGFFENGPAVKGIIIMGVIFVSGSAIMMSSSYFALIDPIVPLNMRGRFFGMLSFICQSVVLLVGFVVPFFLGESPPAYYYSIMFVVFTALQIPRIFTYNSIPELEKSEGRKESFIESVMGVVRMSNFMAFSCYVFFLMLAIGCTGSLFQLIEKEVLEFGDDSVVWLTNAVLFGNLIGFLIAGKPIDRFGTKPIFLICHFSYSFLIFCFIGRDYSIFPMFHYLVVIKFIFGLVAAASYVAITTEMMALIPGKNKSMASAFNMMLFCTGMSLSSIISSGVVNLGILKDRWIYDGIELSNYDAILVACGFAVILMLVSLGLVPSVVQKSVKMRLPIK